MNKEIKDMSASVRTRLTAIAKDAAIGRNLDSIVLNYMQERFLYRLSVSAYVEHFVLKGGLFLYSIHGFKARPTQDIDFLGRQFANNVDKLKKIFQDISAIKCQDGIEFNKESVEVDEIQKDGDYVGKRVTFQGKLGVIPKTLQIDIGFGDKIIPRAILMDYPTLLEGMPGPQIYGYSRESVIAEKFETMVKKLEYNSRMKDFFDIYYFATHNNFEGLILQEAIKETFTNRQTPLEKHLLVFGEAFSKDPTRKKYWKAFQSKMKVAKDLSLQEVLALIKQFISPVWAKICREDDFIRTWDHNRLEWVHQSDI